MSIKAKWRRVADLERSAARDVMLAMGIIAIGAMLLMLLLAAVVAVSLIVAGIFVAIHLFQKSREPKPRYDNWKRKRDA